jgi:hypothetical protein
LQRDRESLEESFDSNIAGQSNDSGLLLSDSDNYFARSFRPASEAFHNQGEELVIDGCRVDGIELSVFPDKWAARSTAVVLPHPLGHTTT